MDPTAGASPDGACGRPVHRQLDRLALVAPAQGPLPDKYLVLGMDTAAGSVAGTVTSYRQTGLTPATTYQYRVVAWAAREGNHLAPGWMRRGPYGRSRTRPEAATPIGPV